MKLLRPIMLAALSVAAGGCATPNAAISGLPTRAQFQTTMDSWVGQREDALVQQWGNPQSVYGTEGSRFLQWTISAAQIFPAMGPGPYGIGGSPGAVVPLVCQVTAHSVNGIIKNLSWRGNGCVSNP